MVEMENVKNMGDINLHKRIRRRTTDIQFTHTVYPYSLQVYSYTHKLTVYAGVTILLSLTVFTLVVADAMPRTSEATPIIGKFSGPSRLI
jgi:hypothetical protein